LLDSGNPVSAQIVQHNNIAGLKDRAQHLFHIGGEDVPSVAASTVITASIPRRLMAASAVSTFQ
jgi:hypothetical protein